VPTSSESVRTHRRGCARASSSTSTPPSIAGIAGGHIEGFNSHGIVAVKDREVGSNDVRRVIDAAKAVAIPMDREVIHVIPQEFIIDDQDGIREPLGMSGVRLEAKIHIVTAAVTSAQNIVKCANKAGLNVVDIVLEPLASAEAVLAGDERDLGVCLIDIGGGTTDLAVFADGSIKHTSVLGLGGYHITNDIAVGLRTPCATWGAMTRSRSRAWEDDARARSRARSSAKSSSRGSTRCSPLRGRSC
jgi:cell division protein FtsA